MGRKDAGIKEHRRVGVLKDQPGVTAQEEVNHRGIAAYDQGRYFLPADPGPGADLVRQPPDVLCHQAAQLFQIVSVFLHRQNPVQNVETKADLTVDTAGMGNGFAGQHIHQLHFQRGRADVQRQTIKRAGGIPRLHPGDFQPVSARAQGNRHPASETRG